MSGLEKYARPINYYLQDLDSDRNVPKEERYAILLWLEEEVASRLECAAGDGVVIATLEPVEVS